MKSKTLLLAVVSLFTTAFLFAQSAKNSTQKPIIGYAITATEKGQTGWKEIRQVDIRTGTEVKAIYKDKQDIELLNARTGKPIVKKDISMNAVDKTPVKKIVNLDQELDKTQNPTPQTYSYTYKDADGKVTTITRTINNTIDMNIRNVMGNYKVSSDKPFATNSAALAYDKKHERLYYTPMYINQLRYIDLNSNKIYYFEDESFGMAGLGGDAGNQITRMVIGSDGNGYALTNNADHLIRFTTGKNPSITDLGGLTDDAANGKFSVHNRSGYGGDIIADASKNLYLITANRNVFKFNIDGKVASYLGTIKGLPQGFSTNGAMVEEAGKVIVCSSELTTGYFRFDLANMDAPAELVSTGSVFNASDLANGNLAFEKEKKKSKRELREEQKEEETKPVVTEEVPSKTNPIIDLQNNGIAVYPNPVSNGIVKLSFNDQPAGKYQVQFFDMSGKLMSEQEVNINNKVQIEEFKLPSMVGKGSYVLKISNPSSKVSSTTKLVVQ